MNATPPIVRYIVFALFVAAALIATGSWLIRTRRVSPFTPLGRLLRAVTDPVIRPVESRILGVGGNPVNAGWWLVIGVAVVGVIVVALSGWVIQSIRTFNVAAHGGTRAIVDLAIGVIYSVLVIALFARVIASWFGLGAYSRWMRPAYFLTDWFVNPIRRLMPRGGMLDFSPLVALILLWLVRQVSRALLL